MAKFKRYASATGFRAVSVSRDNVNKILQQGARDSKLLKELAESDLRESKRQNAGANAAFDFEQEQEQRNFEIADRNAQNAIRAAQSEAEVFAREAQQPSSLQNAFKSIATLSATAAKAYQQYETKQEEITKQNDINRYFSDPEYRDSVDAAAMGMTLQNNAVSTEALSEVTVADALSSDKLPVAQVARQIIKLSPGQQEAYVRAKAMEYPAYIATWYSDPNNNMEIGGQVYTSQQIAESPELYGRAFTQLRADFNRSRGLDQLSIEGASVGLSQMVQVEGQLVASNADEFVEKQRSLSTQGANTLYAELENNFKLTELGAQAQIPQIWSQLLYGNSGDFSQTLQQYQDMVEATDNPVLKRALESYKINGDMTIMDYPRRAREINNNRTQRQIDDENRKQRAAQAQLTQQNRESGVIDTYKQQLEEAKGDPVKTQQVINAIEEDQRSRKQGFNVSDPTVDQLTQQYSTKSAEGWRQQFEEDEQNGTLTEAQADAAPTAEERETYRTALDAQEEAKYGPNYDETTSTLKGYAQSLTEVPGQPSRSSDAKNPYESMIYRDLQKQFKAKFDKFVSEGKSTNEASQLALSEVGEMVEAGLINEPNTRYTRDVGKAGVKFTNPQLGKDFAGPATLTPQQIQKNIQNPNFPNIAGSVLTPAQLRVASQTYNADDGTFYIPQAVQRVVGASGGKLKPIELINKQIEALNKTLPEDEQIGLLEADDYSTRIDEMDEESLKIFSAIPYRSFKRMERVALPQSSNRSQVLQSSNRVFKEVSPLTQKLVSAIIGKESGGDSTVLNRSGSGAIGYGQVMPENVGPWTNTYLGYQLTPAQFRADPDAQMTVVTGKLNDILKDQLAAGYPEDIAIRRAASIWYSGQGDLYNNDRPQYWNGDPYPSIGSYTQNVLDRVQGMN